MRRRTWIACTLNALLISAAAVVAEPPKPVEEIPGKVVAVLDGDSLTLQRADETKITVRLEGIDAPEWKQPYGEKAKKALAALVMSKDVTVRKTGEDKYGRTLGVVLAGGEEVGLQLVQSGAAWHFKKYNSDKRLAAAEEQARTGKQGLWADDNAVAPWDYRARQMVPETDLPTRPKPKPSPN